MASKDHYVELESPELSLDLSPECTIGSSLLSVDVDNSAALTSLPPSSPPPLPARSARSSVKTPPGSAHKTSGSALKRTPGSALKKTPGSAHREKRNFLPDPVYIRDSVRLTKCTPRKEQVEDNSHPVTYVTAKRDQQQTGTAKNPWEKWYERGKKASTRPENNCSRFLACSGFFCCCALVVLVFVFMLLSILGVVINVIVKINQMKGLMD